MASAATRNKAGRRVIAVTGMGVVTSLGVGKDDNWSEIDRRPFRHPPNLALSARRPAYDDRRRGRYRISGRHDDGGTTRSAWRMLAREEAIARIRARDQGSFSRSAVSCVAAARDRMAGPHQAGGDGGGQCRYATIPTCCGVAPEFAATHGAFKFAIIGEHLAEHLGTEGSPISLNTACASGASAIQLGLEAIRRGECEAALALGADGSLTRELLVRFSLLSALSTQNDPPERASKPFSKNRDGFVLAEGAAALVLEDFDHARARGARILGILEGCRGEIRLVPPHPIEPRRQADHRLHAQCARRRRRRARGRRLHQRARHLDAGERQDGAPRRLDGVSASAPARIPISSNKSMIGHTLTAAGAVEAVFTLLTLEHQRIPPTINHKIPDPAIQLDVVPNVARDAQRQPCHLQFLRLWRPECLPGHGAGAGVTGIAEQTIGSERRSDPSLRSMRALTLVADRKIELRDVAAPPAPAAGEVQIRIKAIGLNHLDVWGWRGMAFAKRKLPLIVGVEAAGEIVAVGRETGEFKIGDRVVAYGGLTCGTCKACREGRDNLCENIGGIMGFHVDGFARDLVNMPARLVIPIPPQVSFRDAACAPDRLFDRAAHAVRQRQARTGRDHPGAGRRLGHRHDRHQDGEGDRLHRHHHRGRRRKGGEGQGARRRPRDQLPHRAFRGRRAQTHRQERRRRRLRACRTGHVQRLALCAQARRAAGHLRLDLGAVDEPSICSSSTCSNTASSARSALRCATSARAWPRCRPASCR